jgi:hypothetical protein
MRKLKTQQQVIDALGGVEALCAITGANRKQVWHWYGRAKVFPAYTHPAMTKALKLRGKEAHDALWSSRRNAA